MTIESTGIPASEQTGRETAPISTRDRVDALLSAGYTVTESAHLLNVSKPTVCHHARRLGHPPAAKYNKRYDWHDVQRYYDAGHTVRECRERYGFANQTWNNAVRRGDVIARDRAIPIEALLVAGRSETSRHSLKRRLLTMGLKQARCEECGIEEWRGRPLAMALHHVNGHRDDNRLENLSLLCPNCHSQTDNFAGRNRGRSRA